MPRQCLFQLVPVAIRIQPHIGNSLLHGRHGTRTRAQWIFVGSQLDDVVDAQLTLKFADGLANYVGCQLPHGGRSQATRPGSLAVRYGHRMARGYDPRTRNSDARLRSSVNAFATGTSAA